MSTRRKQHRRPREDAGSSRSGKAVTNHGGGRGRRGEEEEEEETFEGHGRDRGFILILFPPPPPFLSLSIEWDGDDAMRENGMVLCSHNQTTLKEREKECRAVGRGEVERGEATTRASSPQFRALPKGPAWRTMRPRKLGTMYCEEEADCSSLQGSGDR